MHLVVGASGVLGSRIVERLLKNNLPVRVVSRNPEKLDKLQSKGVDVVRGDLLDASWMDGALKGVQYLFLATHGLVPPSRKNNILKVDDAGNRRIIDAAKRAGVSQVIFTSALLAQPDATTTFGKIKFKIEEYIKNSGLKYTIVRPPAYIETHGLILIGEPLRKSGKVQFLGTGSRPINWISAEDVADYMVESIDDPDRVHTVKSIAGPDVVSRIQMLEIFERMLNKKGKRSHLPISVLKMMRVLFRPINPALSYLFEVAIEEENPGKSQSIPMSVFDWIAPKTAEEVIKQWAR